MKETHGRQEGMVEGRSFRDARVKLEKYTLLEIGTRSEACKGYWIGVDICLWGHNHVRKHGHLLCSAKDTESLYLAPDLRQEMPRCA